MMGKRLLAALSKNQNIKFKNAVSELTLMAAKEKEAMFNLKNQKRFLQKSKHNMAYFYLFPATNFSCLAFPEINSSGQKFTHLTWSLPEQKKTQV